MNESILTSAANGNVQKSPSSKAAAFLTRGAYSECVSTAKRRERRWWLFSTFPIWICLFLPGAFSHSHACESGTHTTQPNLFQEESSGLSQVIESLRQSTPRERTFHETYYSGMLTTPARKEGTLVFHPPTRLEKHVQTPAKESFIAEGDNLHYENPSREISQTFALQDYPALASLIAGLRSLFNGDEQTLRQFFHVSMAGTPDHWQVQLSPKTHNEDDGVDCIRLAGDHTHLRTISIFEINGDRSELQLDPQVP